MLYSNVSDTLAKTLVKGTDYFITEYDKSAVKLYDGISSRFIPPNTSGTIFSVDLGSNYIHIIKVERSN